MMMRLIALAAVTWLTTTSVQAMPMAPVHEADGIVTQAAYGCGAGRTRVRGVAWPEPPFAKLAGVFGVAAFAFSDKD